ncbi:Retrovirus-related Pol polyprotein from transposon 297 [Vitis vinifera]|uniref:Retrovirus-related Pol polyprotein from transposon 297 n=1 Tax=Vitis vinifera TaxID=29760 RepID=A0A438G7M4_VITVI|nr:Retrovirus-related Pol polyprotein from transposon 297 [Vitis vinifera]
MIGGTIVEKALLDLGASVNLLPYSVYNQLGLVDFVILDTDPIVKETNYVPIILGRPFLATSNAIINCRNGLMQLTFGNMTLELNIFYMSKKPITPEEEEGPKKVCIIDTLMEEHCNQKMQDKLNENLEDLEEGLPEPSDVLATLQGVCLLEVLKRCKKAIGWQISDLKGISPLLLQAGIIYPISDSPWVSPTQVVPKKSGITVVKMKREKKLLHASLQAILSIVSWTATRVFSNRNDVEDQEKTTFTCPFGTYAYRRMPFGLCNAPATFQRCMLSIFSDMVERIMEDLVLNWEKCHFMVQQGIVLGHIISEKGIEVDKAKVELIVKLPSPTTVKGVRQFLGHAGFYRRSFDQLKQFLTTAPIVRAPNWQLPFEVMCDASDFAIGAVLGQREDGKPYVIYYASKTLNEAQRNYTTQRKNSLKYLLTKQDAKARLIRWISYYKSSISKSEIRKEWRMCSKKVESTDRKHFFAKIHAYYWEEPFLFKYCADQIIRKCVPKEEQQGILSHCHESACGGHFASQKTAMKVLQSGFSWPSLFKDAHTMYYVSKWVEAIPCKHNDHRVVLKFLKENIFSRFGVPKAIISDGGTHFCNKPFETLLAKYGVKHKVATPYHS